MEMNNPSRIDRTLYRIMRNYTKNKSRIKWIQNRIKLRKSRIKESKLYQTEPKSYQTQEK
ncbi:hypothetical protein C0674_03620 [Sporolactobacillus terrae]|uniref:Uncharacterized protein n=1 Tax=Sporolactobacillus terrae TaxID=269673 RepID=A0ABX5Q554_9BACL|nr:hypothetical protein C0674_03620 [Sporolactobacillus terrae]QAA24754.1 hypothetical protein C0679_03595 [Sporolactobacillus terrae]